MVIKINERDKFIQHFPLKIYQSFIIQTYVNDHTPNNIL